ncbi:MAG: hypothetical protein NTW19_08490 [Planctomycetota bacterium]|nr:hypothetical protein [Planctomycetota bacterium]
MTSPDYQWTAATRNAAFAPRDGAGAITYKNKMWLLGGWNPDDKTHFPKICNSEVWNSVDGVTWNLILKQAPWEGRHCAGYIVFKDRMFIVGGDLNQGHYQTDVWSSDDGLHWDLVTEKVPWGPRVFYCTAVLNGRIYVFGGQTIPDIAPAEEIFHEDVWRSDDGHHWTKILDHVPWAPRLLIGGAAVHEGKLWIIGGGTYDTPKRPQRLYFNDVWNSPDGIHWTQVAKSSPWRERQMHDVAVFDGRLWVMGGYNATQFPDEKTIGNRRDVWHSADGVAWTELLDTPWPPRHGGSAFVHDGALWMVAGNNMTPDAWRLERRR